MYKSIKNYEKERQTKGNRLLLIEFIRVENHLDMLHNILYKYT